MKTALKIFGLLILAAIIAGGIFAYRKYQDYQNAINTPVSDSQEKVEVTITQGETVEQIAADLKSKGLIKDELYFKVYLKQQNLATSIQAGTFRIPRNLSMSQVVLTLQHADKPDIWVTIPEGLMVTEIASTIDEEFQSYGVSDFSKQEFLDFTQTGTIAINLGIPVPEGKPLEGYLFPDTYRFPSDASAEYVLTAILENFKTKVLDKYTDDIDKSGRPLYDTLILASILERETRHPDDRPIVADILIRRLDNGWPLGVDATLLYYFGDWKHEITYDELQQDNPYNTRKVIGLTPTPICNPGEQTIRSVLEPEPNDYWFYVSDAEGILHYATTEEEHNQNIQQYIQ